MTQQHDEGAGRETGDRLREVADAASDKLKEAGASAQDMVENVTEQAREYGQKAQAAAKQAKPFVEKSLKEQPMRTLAGAAVIGFLLGALWKR
jgi:ElaB/YqjD/DUF883 family membrane-anchored ribosome-binding protein